jgi:hypothetical protein
VFLSAQLEECIVREFNAQGIEGYNKCFMMFGKLLEWETRETFLKDPLIIKGIRDNMKAKFYNRFKGQKGGDGNKEGGNPMQTKSL